MFSIKRLETVRAMQRKHMAELIKLIEEERIIVDEYRPAYGEIAERLDQLFENACKLEEV